MTSQTQGDPLKPEFVQKLRDLGEEELAHHLEHAYLLLRSQRDALGEIVTHAAETLQTEGIADWGDGGELGDALLYVKDTVEEQYNNTKDLEGEFAGPYDEVVARRKTDRRDLVIRFLEYLLETCDLMLVERGQLSSAQRGTEHVSEPTTRSAEQLVAEFFARIE
jgi:hypothetical protein